MGSRRGPAWESGSPSLTSCRSRKGSLGGAPTRVTGLRQTVALGRAAGAGAEGLSWRARTGASWSPSP